MSKKLYRTFKVRLLPTQEQETKFYEFNSACRYIWNKCLQYQIKQYSTYNSLYLKKENTYKYFTKFTKLFTLLKKRNKFNWLNNICRHTLMIKIKDMKEAYNKYYKFQDTKEFSKDQLSINISKRKHHPKFKKKKDDEVSIPFDSDRVYFKSIGIKIKKYRKIIDEIDKKLYVQLPKIGKVLVQTNYKDLPEGIGYLYDKKGNTTHRFSKIKNPRLKLINNKWILFFVMEVDSQDVSLKNNILGIDLGIKELCVCSNGKTYSNINKTNKRLKRLDKRLKHLHKQLDRKYKFNKSYTRSNNINKTIKSLRKVYYKSHNIRINYIHKVSKEIVTIFPKAIILEDINLNFMIKNHKLSKATNDQLLGTFREMIKYKAENYNIQVILADKYYPSTQLCSKCNNKQHIKLSDRTYKCPNCGLKLDRDFNAAINLEHYGSQLISLRKKLVDVLRLISQK